MKVTEVHERMVRNVWLEIELKLNKNIREISEYDVQNDMFLAFEASLKNTGAYPRRERAGKVDCVLYDSDSPKVFYEIKTYFKDNEQVLKKHFDNDLKKLVSRLKEHSGTRRFFFIAGTKRKIRDLEPKQLRFVQAHLGRQHRRWVDYQETTGGDPIRLRPSKMERQGRSVVMTWEAMI